jgi:hypothetical protein
VVSGGAYGGVFRPRIHNASDTLFVRATQQKNQK